MSADSYTLADLRYVLRRLYEPRALHSSPLLQAFELESSVSAPLALRLAVTEAIETLKPAPDQLSQGLARRAYEVLHYRYVQQCSLSEVAEQVGLSKRQLKREQRKALERLAQALEESHQLRFEFGQGGTDEPRQAPALDSQVTTVQPHWAADATQNSAAALQTVLPDVLRLMQPITERHGVSIIVQPLVELPAVATDAVTLRQMLLSVLSVALRHSAGDSLEIAASLAGWRLEIGFRSADGALPAPTITPQDQANLDVAQQLAASCGGGLAVAAAEPRFAATVTLPLAQTVAVLAIDDHDDAIRLLQRYVMGTRYSVYGAHSAEETMTLVRQATPQIIVLDVMMPQVDGWELLGRLKEHPLTCGVPVVVCTIVAQEELALALGVSAFLRKPVTRDEFLRMLVQLTPDGA